MDRIARYEGVYENVSKTKRHNGRPDACFYISLRVDGKKKWIKIGWRSEGINAAFASQRRAEMINELRHGRQPGPVRRTSMTLAEAYALWYRVHAKVNLRSADTVRYHWSSLVEPHLGHLELAAITPLDLEEYKSRLQGEGRAPQTVKHGLALIRRIYRKMVAWDKFSGPVPTDRVAMPVVSNSRERWLTPHEARRLLGRIKRRSDMMYRMAMISLHTGMRWGEVAALRGENINLGAGTIRVQDSKTGADRTVYVTPAAAQALSGVPLLPGALVWPSRAGSVRRAPSDTFERCVAELGLNEGITDRRDRVVFHTLRHTFGSWLAMSGVPLYTIATLMGHSSQVTTQRYAHLCPDVQRVAVEHVQRIFHSKSVLSSRSSDSAHPDTP
ncbi:tyrosine-type recombinase/integrase [Pseudodesulfovibrio pelocollis]|uniref:tyrosine-type recombinase/integrase n=1 Tax=Pseudodesulfovibrio pelocollis TaxID=3051432 RepID=UPI00255B1DBF|nr:site-specific integrase [Pseudodesulfovibrio sp. SB368]